MKRKELKKRKGSTLMLILVFVVGLSLLLYPTISNLWNVRRQSKAISNYTEAVASMSKEEQEKIVEKARQYNEKLRTTKNRWVPTDEMHAEYEQLLNVDGLGIMGYIEIPRIRVSLPIYHGTENTVLQVAAGHIEGSSLPVGGEGTHSAMSGHRGLPSATLFSDLEQLEVGDVFQVKVLQEVLTYEVDQILIAEPNDMSGLDLVKGEDYCTLVTCTPYGINTHRILVRGHRIETVSDELFYLSADAERIDPTLVASILAVPVVLILLVILLVDQHRKKKGGKHLEKGGKDIEKE